MLFFSFVVGLTFRALSDDGLLLYATDNDTHPTQFFSVELVEGRILFQFNSGRGLVSISTKQRYSGNGHWYTVCIMGNMKTILSEDHNLMSISTNFGDEVEVEFIYVIFSFTRHSSNRNA